MDQLHFLDMRIRMYYIFVTPPPNGFKTNFGYFGGKNIRKITDYTFTYPVCHNASLPSQMDTNNS